MTTGTTSAALALWQSGSSSLTRVFSARRLRRDNASVQQNPFPIVACSARRNIKRNLGDRKQQNGVSTDVEKANAIVKEKEERVSSPKLPADDANTTSAAKMEEVSISDEQATGAQQVEQVERKRNLEAAMEMDVVIPIKQTFKETREQEMEVSKSVDAESKESIKQSLPETAQLPKLQETAVEKQKHKAKRRQAAEALLNQERERKMESDALLEAERKKKEESEMAKRKEMEVTAAREREAVLKKIVEEELERKKRIEEAAIARKREIQLALSKVREETAKTEARRREIMSLAGTSTLLGNKIFFYPEPVQAGGEVEIYLNRSITALANEPNVQIMGAFNDWKWNSFVTKLEKSNLGGDWWTCKINVPKEAYRIDFVFFNGEKLYENNEKKDFYVVVDGGMNREQFEAFLVLEKRKESERLALEQAERERAAAEAQRLAEEIAAEQADRAESKRQVSEQRAKAQSVLQKASKSKPGLWDIEPSNFGGGQSVKLYYNSSSRPLAYSRQIWLHGGYNNWQESVSIVSKLSPATLRGANWWMVEVLVPQKAYVLNWVFADGKPEKADIYDNNGYEDFHALVPDTIPEDMYWSEIEQALYDKLRAARLKKEEAARKKVELKSRMKEEMKANTTKAFLLSQAHIFYTDPLEIKAEKPATVLYNPSNGMLCGKPEIWLRSSFNRWTHRLGPLPPIMMVPSSTASHVKATVNVPEDAYVMDFVFSEKGDESGGAYDNRNGLDYHIPVANSKAKEPPLSIVHVAVEMAPIAKVGGLADVVTSLSRAVKELGHNVEVILPKYDCLNYKLIRDLEEKQHFVWGGTKIRVWNGKVEGLSVHFIEPENGIFWAGCVYGRRDDGNRFSFFCHAALEFLLQSGRHPDIIHCHDWSSAPVAWLFQENYKHYGLSNTRIVFTIHNLEFGPAQIGKAMANSNMATTVSETYATEVSAHSSIAPHLEKFYGIRNGIDLDIWDPFDDLHIPMSYTSEQVIAGKRAAKRELQHRLGLEQIDKPLVGIITRLTAQKGIHLIKHAIWRTLERGGQVILLGCAPDPRVQNDFINLSNQLRSSPYCNMANLCLTYDEPLSHLIYAGSDFILVPSIFEPCGLTQLTAMRYGSIPVVRRTGGLNDTVFDVDHDRDRAKRKGLEPNGFSFDGTDAAGVDYALNRALSAWYEAREWFDSLRKKVMEQDWSWNQPALDYVELYYGAKK